MHYRHTYVHTRIQYRNAHVRACIIAIHTFIHTFIITYTAAAISANAMRPHAPALQRTRLSDRPARAFSPFGARWGS